MKGRNVTRWDVLVVVAMMTMQEEVDENNAIVIVGEREDCSLSDGTAEEDKWQDGCVWLRASLT